MSTEKSKPRNRKVSVFCKNNNLKSDYIIAT